MVEPITITTLLVGVFTDLAREGISTYVRKVTQASASDEYNLAGRATVTTRLELSFSAPQVALPPLARPYWVLVGLQSRNGARREVPALYGERLSLVIPRDEYDIVTLFLSRPRSFKDKPYLTAFGSTHDVLAGQRQQLTLRGQLPTDQLVGWLDRRFPAESRNFRLLPSRPALPTSLKTTVGQRSGTGRAPAPPLSQAPRRALLEPAKPKGMLPSPRPPAPRKAAATPPARRVEPASQDGKCLARLRSGQRCHNAAKSARGTLCERHFTMVSNGQVVLWSRTGTPIRLLNQT